MLFQSTKYFWRFRKQRFVYGTILDSIAKVAGIIKFDLHAEPDDSKTKLEVGANVQGLFDLGPGRFGSEAVFVPRIPGITSEEDDGYLVFFVHDENTGYCFPLPYFLPDHLTSYSFLLMDHFIVLFSYPYYNCHITCLLDIVNMR